MRIYLILVLLTFLTSNLVSQDLLKSGILEPPVPYDFYHLIEAEDDGLIVMLRSATRTRPSKKNKIIKTHQPKGSSLFYYMCSYNSRLELNYILEIPVAFSELPRKKKRGKGHLAFVERIFYKNKKIYMAINFKKELHFYTINTQTNEVKNLDKNFKRRVYIESAGANNNGVYAIGKMLPRVFFMYLAGPFVLLLKYKDVMYASNSSNTKVLFDNKDFDKGERYFFDCLISSKGSSRYIVTSEIRKRKHRYNLYIDCYDDGGNLTNAIVLHDDSGRSFNSAHLLEINENSFIVSGLYTNKKNEYRNIFSNGVYYARYVNNKLDFIKYYEYVDMPGYQQLTSDRKGRKVTRKQAKGIDVSLSIGNIEVANPLRALGNNKYVMSLEKLDPIEQTSTSRITGSITTKIIGYKFNSVFTLMFNDDGTLIYTNPLAIDKVIPVELYSFHSNYMYHGNDLYIALINEYKFDTYIVNENGMKANGIINFSVASNGLHTDKSSPFFYFYNVGDGNVMLNYKKYAGLSKKIKDTRENIYYSLYKFIE